MATAHIDIRTKVWPVYIKGVVAIELPHCDLDITVKDAEKVLEGIREGK